MKQLILAATLATSIATIGHVAQAQGAGVAIVSMYPDSDPFLVPPFLGPFRITPTGIDLRYLALCYHTGTRVKAVVQAVAAIPDGSTLADMRALSTTAVVDACAEAGIIVARTSVILPAVQLGQ